MARTGRPHRLAEQIGERPVRNEQGELVGHEPITVGDQITSDLRAGLYLEQAAQRAGVGSSTVYRWLRDGQVAARTIEAGDTSLSKLRAYDRRCHDFWQMVEGANVEAELRALADHQRIARGNVPVVETVVKVDAEGNEIERRTKTTATLPDARANEWFLKHRFPERWSETVRLEGTGEDGAVPVEVRIANLAEALEQYHDQVGEDGG